MANENFVSLLAGWTADNYYEGPAGFMPGGSAFLASALFHVLADVGADQYIVQNRDVGTNRGWALLTRAAGAAGAELLVQVGDGVSMNEDSLGSVPFGHLTLVHIAVQPNAVDLYVQGTRVSTLAVTGLASALAPRIGTDQGGANPAGGVQVVGVGYTPNAQAFAPTLAALHYQNCRLSFDMAQFVQAPAGTPNSDFDNRWTARTGAAVPIPAGVDPATVLSAASWAPFTGAQALTRASDGFGPLATTLTNPPWAGTDV